MRKLDTPKRVTLPNDRVFYAKYERIKRSEVPQNIVLRRTYRQRAAPRGRRRRVRGQRACGFFDTIKKIAKNPAVRNLVKTGIRYAPKLYNYGVYERNDKTTRKILGSDTPTNLVDNFAVKYSAE